MSKVVTISENNIVNQSGTMSDKDIIDSICSNDLKIFPFSEKNLTGSGYNLTATNFVFSTSRGITETVHNSRDGGKYVYIQANDTVLIMTKESVSLSENLCGTIHSRVRIVSQGFGHISTTIDPQWNGPLLIALNNPTSKRKKFYISRETGKGEEEASFCTIVLHKMIQSSIKKHDNPPQRIDVLKEYVIKPPKWPLFVTKKSNEFSEIVGNLDKYLPPRKTYSNVNIEKLQNLHEECSQIYKEIVDGTVLGKRLTNIYIPSDLKGQNLFDKLSKKVISDEIEELEEIKAYSAETLERASESFLKIIRCIESEKENKQYQEYLLKFEELIPETPPQFLRFWDELRKRRRYVIWCIVLMMTAFVCWQFLGDRPEILWSAISGTVAVFALICTIIKK